MRAKFEITQGDGQKTVTEAMTFQNKVVLDEYFNSLVDKLSQSKFIRVADKIINTDIIKEVSIIKEGDKECQQKWTINCKD